jgi:hypothetical protein
MNHLLRFIVRQLALLAIRINFLEDQMTTNQEHLDADIAVIDAKYSDAIQHLKDQIAAGVPAGQLDFSKADAVVAKSAAEDVADTPPVEAPATPVVPAPPVADPVSVADPVTPVPPAVSAPQPVYTFSGGQVPAEDASVWPTAPFKTADGTQLYYFASDVVGSPAAGDNAGGVWHVYTGPVTAA